MAIVETASEYPPPHHVLRDLALSVQPGQTVNRAWLPVTEHVCNRHGHVATGLVATMVDAICGGLAAVTAAPGWIATADLSMHVARPLVGDELAATARVRRSGRTTVILEAEVTADGRAETLATATASFSILQRRDSNPVLAPTLGDDEPRREFIGGSGAFTADAYDACGFVRGDDGEVSVAVTPYIQNSLGGVQGGVLASLVDAATVHALGPEFETVDIHLVYLALAKVGPIRACPVVMHRDERSGTVAITIDDDGANRHTTRATAVGVRW